MTFEFLSRWLHLAGRVLLAQLFVLGAVQKLFDPAPAMALLAERGLPEALIWPATLFNGAVALALVLNWRPGPTGCAVALYCGVTSLFHLEPDDPWQMSIFVKNWAIAGGALLLAAEGSRLRNQSRPLGSGAKTDHGDLGS